MCLFKETISILSPDMLVLVSHVYRQKIKKIMMITSLLLLVKQINAYLILPDRVLREKALREMTLLEGCKRLPSSVI